MKKIIGFLLIFMAIFSQVLSTKAQAEKLTIQQLNEVVEKLGGAEKALELIEEKHDWIEKNGIIYFSLTSDGATGEEWISRLESKGIQLNFWTKKILRSKSFRPINGTIYKIAVLKGEYFSDDGRITNNIRTEAKNKKFITPNIEVVCLIRDKFTDKEIKAMGLTWIVNVMHNPTIYVGVDPRFLGAFRDIGHPWLCSSYGSPKDKWSRDFGFVFVVSQVSGSRF